MAVQICRVLREFRAVLDPNRVDLWIDDFVKDTEAKIKELTGEEVKLSELIN